MTPFIRIDVRHKLFGSLVTDRKFVRPVGFEGTCHATQKTVCHWMYSISKLLLLKTGFLLLKLTYTNTRVIGYLLFSMEFRSLQAMSDSRALHLIQLFIRNFFVRAVVPIRRVYTDSMDSIKYLWRMRACSCGNSSWLRRYWYLLYYILRWALREVLRDFKNTKRPVKCIALPPGNRAPY